MGIFSEPQNFIDLLANIAGSEYNLGIGTIKVLVNGIASITSVYNYTPTTGGTDRQTNTEYALSIQDAILGNSKINIVNILITKQAILFCN